VREISSDAIVAHQSISTPAGGDGEAAEGNFKIHAHAGDNGEGSVRLEVWEGGKLTDSVLATFTIKEQKALTSWNKLSLQLQDADLKDVVRNFAKVANLEPKLDDGVDGKVTVELRDVAWDQALQQILSANGCTYAIEGKTLHVRRM